MEADRRRLSSALYVGTNRWAWKQLPLPHLCTRSRKELSLSKWTEGRYAASSRLSGGVGAGTQAVNTHVTVPKGE